MSGGGEDEERMRLLRDCLRLYEGMHAFHNFTKRRLYREPQRQRFKRKTQRDASAGEDIPSWHTCLTLF